MDWRASFVLCVVLASSSGNVPFMSSGYAKTAYTGSNPPDTYTRKEYAELRTAQPDINNVPNSLRVVPTSFSDNRLPLMKNPETIQRTPQEVPTGRALSDSNSLTSAIARSFQDVLPSDINSLTSSDSASSYNDDIQKSPLASEYSYGNNGYYEYPQAQDRYHPTRPYQAGYPEDYFNSPPTGTVSDVGDIQSPSNPMTPSNPLNPIAPSNSISPPNQITLANPMASQARPADTYQPGYPSSGYLSAGYPPYNPYPYTYNPPTPPPPPEEPPEDVDEDEDADLDKGVYTHYNIGRKLYYAPLWYSLYFVGYMFVEIAKHMWRHKYTFPVRAEDALGIGRSAGDNSTNIDEVTEAVTKAIETSTKKYKS